jgi:iron complex transport system substrate-binding protein
VKAFLAPLLLALGAIVFVFGVLRSSALPDLSYRYGPTTVSEGSFPRTLTSGNHRAVLPVPPRRIASLTVSADEILVRLAAPERIAAVSVFADDPAISTCAGLAPRSAARIRGLAPERIISLEPDLVFVAHYTLDTASRILESASIPVVRFREVRTFDDVAANVRATALAVGEDARGDAMIAEMRARLALLTARIRGRERPRVLYYSSGGYSAFGSTLIDEKITRAGGVNAGRELGLSGMKSIALDVLVGLDPDVIVVPRWSDDARTPVLELTQSPAWRTARAVTSGRVYALPARELTSESPDSVAGIESLARLLHPEAFSS